MKTKFAFLILFTIFCIYGKAQIRVSLKIPTPCANVAVIPTLNDQHQIELQVSPNPSEGTFTMSLQSGKMIGNVLVRVMDIKGKVFYSEPIYCDSFSLIKNFVMNQLSNGIYILSLTGSDFKKQQKLIVNK